MSGAAGAGAAAALDGEAAGAAVALNKEAAGAAAAPKREAAGAAAARNREAAGAAAEAAGRERMITGKGEKRLMGETKQWGDSPVRGKVEKREGVGLGSTISLSRISC